MRIGLLATLAVVWLLSGATCLPLLHEGQDLPDPPTTLSVNIESPETDATVSQGAVVDINWTALNNTGHSAVGRLTVESRTVLAGNSISPEVNLGDDEAIEGTRSITTRWDTTDFDPGVYVIYARIATPQGSEATATGPGRITIDDSPTFEFTNPSEDTTFAKGETLTIEWSGLDETGGGLASIGLDPDENDPDHLSGNEIFIHEASLPTGEDDTTTATSFGWTGSALGGDSVVLGTYNLFAFVSDSLSSEEPVEANVRITVEEAEDPVVDPVILKIIRPDEDADFVSPTTVRYQVDQPVDVMIDLKIDTDDGHANGNEATILSQVMIEAETSDEQEFLWRGKYADGTLLPDGTTADDTKVPDGIYRIFISMSTGSGSPQVAQAPKLVFLRRLDDEKTLIAMQEPATSTTVEAGAYLHIRWRDDDPRDDDDKEGHEATIRLAIDDDPDPAEGVETDADEIDLVADLEADPDGSLQDSYDWLIPGWLAPGTYYIFGYIVVDGADEHWSVAPGRFTIPDPDAR